MSIVSGQLISRTGRYKIFPIAGTGVMTAGLFLLSTLTQQSGMYVASLWMLLLGLGLGMVMQVLVIAVQNAVEYRDLGVATSGATLFRLIGGSLGTAALGAIFASQLSTHLARLLPPGTQGVGGSMAQGMSPHALSQLPPALHASYNMAFTEALSSLFLVAAGVCAVAFVLTWFLPEHPLRATVAATASNAGYEAGEAFARPTDESSAAEQLRVALSTMADRDVQRQYIQNIVTRAGETLSPLAAWLLVQIERSPQRDPAQIALARNIDGERTRAAIDELRHRGLIAEATGPTEATPTYALTSNGCATLDRLVVARRAHLAELVADWNPSESPDVAGYLRRAVQDAIPRAQHPTS
jgi:MFS family permease